MVASHKSFLAFCADEFLFTCVSSLVSGQLIGSGESAFAVFPFTNEWFLACVNALMGLKMTGLKVVFTTTRVVALENASSAFADIRSGKGFA